MYAGVSIMFGSKKVTSGKLHFTLIKASLNHGSLVMFFGLTNSPATFQTMMNDIFQELISDGLVVVYILIFTESVEQH